MTSERTPDPFREEAALHGVAFRLFDSKARDACRHWAEHGCKRCVALIEAFDIELSRAFLGGTWP